MKKVITILLCVACLAGQSSAASPHYLQVSVSGLNDSQEPVCPVSLVYDLNHERLLSGVYYIADSSCGITADAAVYKQSGLKFELAYNMKVQADDQGAWLSGSAYSLSYSAGGKNRGLGERTSVEKALLPGRRILVSSFGLQDGRDVQLFITLLDDCPQDSPDCGKNAVSLITSVSNNGKNFAHETQVRKLLAEAMSFQLAIESEGNKGKVSHLRYATMVRIKGYVRSLKQPTKCQVTFERNYQITPDQTSGASNQTTVNYSSMNMQDVILEPGKELRLVFPPDHPSIEGFDIEDTLIIIPR